MKRRLILSLAAIVNCAFPALCIADIVYTTPATIQEVWTWAKTGASVDGDVVLQIQTGLTQCPNGVFIKSADDDKPISSALTAYAAQKPVKLQVYNDTLWSGSNTPYCMVRAIFLQ